MITMRNRAHGVVLVDAVKLTDAPVPYTVPNTT
jgi:hypothetical protein